MNRSVISFAGICRWTARIVGSLLVLVCTMIAIGQGIPNPFSQPGTVRLGFLGLALIFGGIVAGWRWEFSGGAMSILGWCVFVAAVMRPRGMTGFVAALAVPGVLYVTSALLRRRIDTALPASRA